MSWPWVRGFARRHGVPLWHLSPRKPLIPARALLDAMAKAAAERAEDPRSFEAELAAEMADFARDLAISTKPK